jgi:hypothetical protein
VPPQAEAACKAKAKEDLKAFLLSNEVNKKVGGGQGMSCRGATYLNFPLPSSSFFWSAKKVESVPPPVLQ